MLTGAFVDSREPEHIQRLTFGGVPTVVTALECGDLWASCADGELLVIERKTTSDLLGSISDGRVFQQALKMRERSRWAYLVVTGYLQPTHDGKTFVAGKATGWDWNAVQGALLDVQETGVQIVYCEHDNGYEATVQRLAKRSRAGRVLNNTARPARIMTAGETILTALPGIGLERAQDVLAHFERPSQALAWLTWTDTVLEVAGIGNGIKANVRRALGLGDGESLTIWSDEAAAYMKSTMHEEILSEIARGMDRAKELVTA
jgi:ERCC4-type nuclease